MWTSHHHEETLSGHQRLLPTGHGSTRSFLSLIGRQCKLFPYQPGSRRRREQHRDYWTLGWNPRVYENCFARVASVTAQQVAPDLTQTCLRIYHCDSRKTDPAVFLFTERLLEVSEELLTVKLYTKFKRFERKTVALADHVDRFLRRVESRF